MAKGKNKLNKTNSSGWLDDYSEEFAIETYPDGGIIDTIKSFFTEKTDNKSSKSTPTKRSPKTFKIEDKRKVLATSGQPIRPNVDITSGEYDLDVLKGIIESAKRNNLPIEDAKNLAAIAFQESKFGKTDKNIGHVINNLQSRSDLEALTNTYISKMKKADKLGLTDEALRLQVYNGLGVIKPSTEQDYHGFKMKKIYGVPVPNEGISMKKNPLYGKQIMDLRDNVLNQNPEYIKYINNIYNSNSPAPVYSDIELKSWGPFPHLMKFEMGGKINNNMKKNIKKYYDGGLPTEERNNIYNKAIEDLSKARTQFGEDSVVYKNQLALVNNYQNSLNSVPVIKAAIPEVMITAKRPEKVKPSEELNISNTPIKANLPEVVITGKRPQRVDLPEVVITGKRPQRVDLPEVVITGKRPQRVVPPVESLIQDNKETINTNIDNTQVEYLYQDPYEKEFSLFDLPKDYKPAKKDSNNFSEINNDKYLYNNIYKDVQEMKKDFKNRLKSGNVTEQDISNFKQDIEDSYRALFTIRRNISPSLKQNGGYLNKYPAGGYLNYQEEFKGFGAGPQLYQDNSYFRSVMPDNIENMAAIMNQPSVFSGINDILGSVNQGVNQITGLMGNLPGATTNVKKATDASYLSQMESVMSPFRKTPKSKVSSIYDVKVDVPILNKEGNPVTGDKNILSDLGLGEKLSFQNGGYLNKYQNGGEMDMLPVGSPEYIHKSNVFHENYNPVPRVHFSDDTSVFDIGVNLNDLVNMNGGRINQYASGGFAEMYGNTYGNMTNSPRVFNANTNRATAEQLQAATANDFLNTKVRKDRQSFEDDKVDWGFMNWAKQPVGAYLGMMSTVPILGDVTKDIVGDSFLTRTEGYQVGQGVGKTTMGAGKIAGGIATGNIGMVGSGIGDVGSGVGSTVGNLNARSAMGDYNKEGYISGKRLEKSSQDFGDMMNTASSLFGNIKGGIGTMKNMGGMEGMMGKMKGGETGMKGFGNVMSKLTGFGQDGGMVDYIYEDIQEFGKGGLTPYKAEKMLHDKSFKTDKQRKYFGYIASKNKSNGGWLDSL